jgi:hypothetical protein
MTEEFQSCMGGDESVCDSEYERLEDAIARCQAIVRESVDKLRQSGVRTPLIDLYDSKGVQPFVVPNVEPAFVARDYALKVLQEID